MIALPPPKNLEGTGQRGSMFEDLEILVKLEKSWQDLEFFQSPTLKIARLPKITPEEMLLAQRVLDSNETALTLNQVYKNKRPMFSSFSCPPRFISHKEEYRSPLRLYIPTRKDSNNNAQLEQQTSLQQKRSATRKKKAIDTNVMFNPNGYGYEEEEEKHDEAAVPQVQAGANRANNNDVTNNILIYRYPSVGEDSTTRIKKRPQWQQKTRQMFTQYYTDFLKRTKNCQLHTIKSSYSKYFTDPFQTITSTPKAGNNNIISSNSNNTALSIQQASTVSQLLENCHKNYIQMKIYLFSTNLYYDAYLRRDDPITIGSFLVALLQHHKRKPLPGSEGLIKNHRCPEAYELTVGSCENGTTVSFEDSLACNPDSQLAQIIIPQSSDRTERSRKSKDVERKMRVPRNKSLAPKPGVVARNFRERSNSTFLETPFYFNKIVLEKTKSEDDEALILINKNPRMGVPKVMSERNLPKFRAINDALIDQDQEDDSVCAVAEQDGKNTEVVLEKFDTVQKEVEQKQVTMKPTETLNDIVLKLGLSALVQKNIRLAFKSHGTVEGEEIELPGHYLVRDLMLQSIKILLFPEYDEASSNLKSFMEGQRWSVNDGDGELMASGLLPGADMLGTAQPHLLRQTDSDEQTRKFSQAAHKYSFLPNGQLGAEEQLQGREEDFLEWLDPKNAQSNINLLNRVFFSLAQEPAYFWNQSNIRQIEKYEEWRVLRVKYGKEQVNNNRVVTKLLPRRIGIDGVNLYNMLDRKIPLTTSQKIWSMVVEFVQPFRERGTKTPQIFLQDVLEVNRESKGENKNSPSEISMRFQQPGGLQKQWYFRALESDIDLSKLYQKLKILQQLRRVSKPVWEYFS